jgi:diadenosine tetraphosphate (Ap4A) HIT family hydrolase
MSTIFDKIVSGEMKSWTVWEDDEYIAFLTPFPNTPGHTVVTKKVNPGDYIFSVDERSFVGIMNAAKIVAKKLEKAFSTNRVGVLFDGTGVPHLHAQLVPFHANLSVDPEKAAVIKKDNPQYAHHLTAADGPKMDEAELDRYQKMIKEAK